MCARRGYIRKWTGITMKYYIFVIGCDMNRSDAERIATILDILGYKKTDNEDEADILIAVSCSVRLSATNKIYHKGNIWKKRKAKKILTGCVLPEDRKKLSAFFDLIIAIEDIVNLPEMLGYKKENKEKLLDYLSVHPIYESNFRAYVPIMTGCNNFCSYCAVPYTRGREKSRPQQEILKEVKDLIKNGYKEIMLLGQNVNSYQPNFVKLIREIDKFEGKYRVYFYSNHPKDVSDDLIKTLPKLNHFPNYLHLPLQSGNTEILKAMNRHYSKEDYLKLVSKIKEAMPDVAITTDIIVGFPGETDEKFKDTFEVLKKVQFDMAYIARFSPRPGTAAAKLKNNVSETIKKERESILESELGKILKRKNKELVGETLRVLIDSKKGGKYYGRTDSYKVVEVKTDQALNVGQFYDVEISEVEAWKLFATLK